MCLMVSTCIVKRRGLLYNGVDLVIVSIKVANGKGTKWKMGRPNNWAGCTKFGKSINGQGAIRTDRVQTFFEIDKQACPFVRQVRVDFFYEIQIEKF